MSQNLLKLFPPPRYFYRKDFYAMARDSHNSEQQEKMQAAFSHYGQSESQLFF